MDILEAIFTRRSVRQYTDEPVEYKQLYEIIKAGMWAPSGLNNQPWRFVIVRDAAARQNLAQLTKYNYIIETALLPASRSLSIRRSMYHDVKDHQAMGACLQNMLLAAHGMGLGAVWLGEILKSADAVRMLLGLPDTLELMAVVAVGHPAEQKRTSSRKEIAEVLLKEL